MGCVNTGGRVIYILFPKKEWFYDDAFTYDEDDRHGNVGNYSIGFY